MTALTAVTADDFLTRFPEFASANADVIDLVLAEATRVVDDTWCDADQNAAMMYYAAHLLSSMAAQADGEIASVSIAGAISIAFKQSSSEASDDWARTEYGRRFRAMAKINVGGPRVI